LFHPANLVAERLLVSLRSDHRTSQRDMHHDYGGR
jgi:hypothetical protein